MGKEGTIDMKYSNGVRRMAILALLAWAIVGCGGDGGPPDESTAKAVDDLCANSHGEEGCGCLCPGSCVDRTFVGTVAVNGSSTGTAAAGTYIGADGKPHTTSARATLREQAHAKEYDGPVDFSASYTIVVDEKGVLVPASSKVTLTTSRYTWNGGWSTVNCPFTTNPLAVKTLSDPLVCFLHRNLWASSPVCRA
jgi:hypothetical protein